MQLAGNNANYDDPDAPINWNKFGKARRDWDNVAHILESFS